MRQALSCSPAERAGSKRAPSDTASSRTVFTNRRIHDALHSADFDIPSHFWCLPPNLGKSEVLVHYAEKVVSSCCCGSPPDERFQKSPRHAIIFAPGCGDHHFF